MVRRSGLSATYSTLQNDPSGVGRPSARLISNTLGPLSAAVNQRKISDFHTWWAHVPISNPDYSYYVVNCTRHCF
jgi:hypothetical protein